MGLGNLNKAILRGGLSVAAALLLSTAAFAQDASNGDPSTDHVVVQNWHDLNPAAGEGIAVGEPDPTAVDDGTTADDGTTVDDGSDPATGGDGSDVTVQNWHDINPNGGDDGIAVGEPDPNGDGTVAAGDDGTGGDPAVDDGTTDGATDGTVFIQYMSGGPGACINCDLAGPGLPVADSHPGKHNLAQHSQTLTPNRHDSEAVVAVTTAMSQCMTAHPRSAWICEWQNGAGQ